MATKPPLTLEEQTAKAKLRSFAQGVQIWKLEGAEIPQYAVPSTGMDGTAYLLTVPDAEWTVGSLSYSSNLTLTSRGFQTLHQ